MAPTKSRIDGTTGSQSYAYRNSIAATSSKPYHYEKEPWAACIRTVGLDLRCGGWAVCGTYNLSSSTSRQGNTRGWHIDGGS